MSKTIGASQNGGIWGAMTVSFSGMSLALSLCFAAGVGYLFAVFSSAPVDGGGGGGGGGARRDVVVVPSNRKNSDHGRPIGATTGQTSAMQQSSTSPQCVRPRPAMEITPRSWMHNTVKSANFTQREVSCVSKTLCSAHQWTPHGASHSQRRNLPVVTPRPQLVRKTTVIHASPTSDPKTAVYMYPRLADGSLDRPFNVCECTGLPQVLTHASLPSSAAFSCTRMHWLCPAPSKWPPFRGNATATIMRYPACAQARRWLHAAALHCVIGTALAALRRLHRKRESPDRGGLWVGVG
jgi:hypothetical protein